MNFEAPASDLSGLERRVNRIAIPPCSECDLTPQVTVRTDYVVYLRCRRCGAMWHVDKPGRR